MAELRLDGKTALVTGASKGIGRAIAAAFADAGADVVLSSRKAEALDEAAASMGPHATTCVANAGDPEQAAACVDTTMQRHGRLDILVNNAATNPYFGPTIDIDLSRYDKTFQVNLRGPLVWTQAAWRAWMQDHGGVVLNVASVGGLRGERGLGVYNVTKAALIHLTKTLAVELAPGVRVNALAPGLVKTEFARALWEPAEDAAAAHAPLQRLGMPEDIADAALFLASDAGAWITGHTLVVDGGALVRPTIG
ncbi:MAG TPA: SDR family oxidoreductase [Acidimicrobiia bacterium]|jgi:NAD(P)-dependent dehydrogenase (short-subunit alcohol dehydrogenase family)|nr:SDR family oxidoreductase [Acidimicrobiia bacterium]